MARIPSHFVLDPQQLRPAGKVGRQCAVVVVCAPFLHCGDPRSTCGLPTTPCPSSLSDWLMGGMQAAPVAGMGVPRPSGGTPGGADMPRPRHLMRAAVGLRGVIQQQGAALPVGGGLGVGVCSTTRRRVDEMTATTRSCHLEASEHAPLPARARETQFLSQCRSAENRPLHLPIVQHLQSGRWVIPAR